MLAPAPENGPTDAPSSTLPIGEKIQRLLDQVQETPAWLADKVGVPRSTITRILKGERNPTPETLQEIAPVLGVTIAQLAAGTNAEERVKEAKDLVARKDYDEAVHQVIEYERKARDLGAQVDDLRQEVDRERDRTRRVQQDATAAMTQAALLETERDDARRQALRNEEEARRYREALEKAVADVARLREQVRELGTAVDAGRRTGRVGAILAGVAAAVSVASYLSTNEDGETDKPPNDSPKTPRKRKA